MKLPNSTLVAATSLANRRIISDWAKARYRDRVFEKDQPIPNVNGILSGDLCGAILATGNWIDGGAIAFLAQEAGYQVSGLDGKPLPPLYQCHQAKFAGIIIAADSDIHQKLLNACIVCA